MKKAEGMYLDVYGISPLKPDRTRECSALMTDTNGISLTIPNIHLLREDDGELEVALPIDYIKYISQRWPYGDALKLATWITKCVQEKYRNLYLPPLNPAETLLSAYRLAVHRG